MFFMFFFKINLQHLAVWFTFEESDSIQQNHHACFDPS